MSSHKTNSKTNGIDWITPRFIFESLGAFDFDPCCPAIMPWRTASIMIQQPKDGFKREWKGRVWLNPPYGEAQNRWLAKLKEHGNGIALIPASTETSTRFYRYVWGQADGICFIRNRVKFHLPDGSLPSHGINQACCLVAYGRNNLAALLQSNLGAVAVEVGRSSNESF